MSLELDLSQCPSRVQSTPFTPSHSPNTVEEEHLEHSSAFPKSFTYCGYLDSRTNIDGEWNRKYFMVSNNFLVSAATHLSLKLEHIIYLEGSTIKSNTETSFELFAEKQTLWFRTPSIEECAKWISSMQIASKLKIKDIYRFLYILGESGMTKVVAAKHKVSNKESAIKIVDKRICNKKLLKTEIQILRKLDDEYIVNLYDIIETKKYLYIIMEKCEGGELFDKIVELDGDEHFNEYDCCLIMHQIARGVKYMHSMGIIHRDLKPENILCVEPHSIRKIKIADFGISKIFNENESDEKNEAFNSINTMCTISYTSPEILRNKKYDFRTDYWSIGVILYILLCGYPPFYDDNDEETIKSIINNELTFDDDEHWEHVSNETKDLLKGLLCKDPMKRKTCDDILKLVWKVTNSTSSFEKARENLKKCVLKKKMKRAYSAMPSPNISSHAHYGGIVGIDNDINPKIEMTKSRSMQNLLSLLHVSSPNNNDNNNNNGNGDDDDDDYDVDRVFSPQSPTDDEDVGFGDSELD